MALDYESIRENNIGRYGTEVGNYGKLIFEDQYTERTHFIFELLQNAEDALARRGPEWNGPRAVSFDLTENQLRVSHFGDPFNDEDVKGICQIGNSTKEGNFTAIGRFGIGFKSVYAYTERPGIHSGPEDFVIDDYVLPKATSSIDRKNDQTVFVIPLKSNDRNDYNEISNALMNLRLDTLLFLHHINEISYSIEDGTSEHYLRESVKLDNNVRSVTIIGTGRDQDIAIEWLVFSHPVFNNDISTGNVEIAFERDPKSEKIQPVSESRLVVFFPTVVTTGLGFLVQGPYRTTPSRETVPSNDEWNNYLMRETASLLSGALCWLRDKEILDINVLLSLPLEERENMFDILYKSVKDILYKEALLPKLGGGYIKGENAVLGRSKSLRDLLSSDQLSVLCNIEQSAWLSGEITSDRTPQLYRYILDELGVVELRSRDILSMLSRMFLEKQSDKWILQLYGFLGKSIPVRQRVLYRNFSISNSRQDLISDIPLIRLEDGSQVKPIPEKYFLPGENYTDFPTVKVAVCKTTEAREFLESLNLREPDLVDDIKHNILKKYLEDHISIYNIQELEHEKDMKRIMHVYNTCSPDEKRALIDVLKQVPFVMAVDATNEDVSLQEPTQLYLKTKRLKTLLNEVDGVWFVDDRFDIYQDPVLIEIFGKCGSISNLRTISNSLRSEKIEMLHEKEQNCHGRNPRQGTDWSLDKLGDIISNLSNIDYKQQEQRSRLLWEELIELGINKPEVFKGTYTCFYYYERRHSFDETIFIEQLNNNEWIPHSGELKSPSAILFEDLDWKRDDLLLLKIKFKSSEVAELAEKLGIDPDLISPIKRFLEENEITTPSDFKLFLGDEVDDSTDTWEVDDELSNTDSNIRDSFKEHFLERMTSDHLDGPAKPVIISTGGPTTRESAVSDTKLSNHFGRSGRRVRKEVHQFELTEDAKTLRSRFRDMVLNDYQGRCQICGNLFETREGKNKRHQIFIFHIVPPSRDRRTNHFGNLLGLCGWHYALVSYGRWCIIEKETGNPIKSSEQLVHMLTDMDEAIDDDGNPYIAVPVRFYNVYLQWEHNSETIDKIIRYSRPHWDYLCERLMSEEQSDD